MDSLYFTDSFVFRCVFVTVYRADWCIDLFSCTAATARVFNKLTYLLTYLLAKTAAHWPGTISQCHVRVIRLNAVLLDLEPKYNDGDWSQKPSAISLPVEWLLLLLFLLLLIVLVILFHGCWRTLSHSRSKESRVRGLSRISGGMLAHKVYFGTWNT